MNKIFIIDDSNENLLVLKSTIEDLLVNCEITLCEESLRAVEIAKEIHPDVILTDVLMPHFNGIELCRFFRSDEQLKNIPIIILSGSNMNSEDRIKCLKAGADVFLSKPIKAAELVAQINAMLRLKKAEDDLKRKNINLKAKLSSSEDKFIILASFSPVGIYLTDPKGECIYANPRWLEMAEMTLEEALGKGWENAIHPDDRSWVAERWYKSVESNGKWGYEYRFVTKKGKISWIYGTASRMYDADKKLIGYVGVNNDITTQKVLQVNTERSEEKYRTLFQNAFDAIIIFDPETEEILNANRQVCKLYGFDHEEMVGRSLHDFTKDNEKGRKQIEKTLKQGFQRKYETVHIDVNGKEINLESNSTVINYNGEKAILAVMRDVTEQRKAEERVLEAKNRLEAILSNTSAGYFFIDRNGIIQNVNDAWVQLYKYHSKEEIIGKHFSIIQQIDDLDLANTFVKEIMSNNPDYLNGDFSRKCKDGSIGYHSFSANPVFLDDELVGIEGFIIDITEQKLSEQELLQKQYFLTKAQEIGKVGSWELDVKNSKLKWTDETYKIFDVAIGQEMTHEIFMSFVHPEDRDYLNERWEKAQKKIEPFDIIHRIIINGKIKWLNEKAEIKFDANGNPVTANGFVQDITSQKQAEDELREAKEFAENLLETANSIVVILDVNANIVTFNKCAEDLSGYKKEEVLGKNWFDIFISSQDKQTLSKVFMDVLQSMPKASQNENAITAKNGEIIIVNWNNNIIQNISGEICGVLSIGVDVTDLKKKDEHIKKLSRAVNQSPAFTLITDLNGNIEYINQSFSDETGYLSEEVLGNNPRILQSGEHSKEFYEEMWSILNSGKEWHGEFHNKKKNGELFWESAYIFPILNDENVISNYIKIATNITERKISEDKIKALLKEKEIILHEVHHRIKNNMTAIESLFRIQSRNTDDENVKSAFMDAISRLRGMKVLYDKLYRTSNYRETPIREYLGDLVDEIINLFPNSDSIQVNKEIADFKIPATMNFPISIIINELISNAMKYAFNDDVTNKQINISARMVNGIVVIKIKDNGIGLPEGFDLETVNGFGLKLVQMLTKQINGKFTFELNEGTTWILEFDPEDPE